MKKTILTSAFTALLITVFGVTALYGQERKVAEATKTFDQMEYINAQNIYLVVAEKGFQSEELFTKLAESYYFNAQYDGAVKWYEHLFKFVPLPAQNISKLRYSQSLKATGHNELAQKYYDSYREDIGDALKLKSAVDYAALIQANSSRYEIMPIEGLYSEEKITFGHTKKGNTLIFASTEVNTNSFINRKSGWNGLSYLTLYSVALDGANQISEKPQKLKGHLRSIYHESSAVYTKDLKTMYFTRNNNTNKKQKNNEDLKIYRTNNSDGNWSEPKDLSFNSDTYSSAHPALSPDEKTLYFASNRPGGYGDSDLYSVEINEDGSLGMPINLGPKINTPGRETFPFIDVANGLYFSSDGHFGLGGLDVFYLKIMDDGFGNLLNIGEPINSYADDFAFGIDDALEKGFVSSNRGAVEGSFVYDNIYAFVQTEPIKDVYKAVIEGVVTDKQTDHPIAESKIVLKNPEGQVYAELTTDKQGYYQTETNRYEVYTVLTSKEGYDSDDKLTKVNLDIQQIDFRLQPNEVALSPGIDLAKVLNIPVVYFDYDKSDIRPDAVVELEKLVATMEAYQNLRINIRSHTDSRGNDNYNQKLSERRAKSTMDYIISQGISKSRLTSEGLGEQEVTNKCANYVRCSEEEHQKNRRSEFIILK